MTSSLNLAVALFIIWHLFHHLASSFYEYRPSLPIQQKQWKLAERWKEKCDRIMSC
ncbi:hypothetical protein BJY04DRAFT_179468 [Aspergillus karnatakaensis]|uniref:uncharacterized protein n=1 Tax=Aspergillus karnatakaensis TaxID=1810916 RepID=UPI003CCE43C0